MYSQVGFPFLVNISFLPIPFVGLCGLTLETVTHNKNKTLCFASQA
jgi:hypothetical protein